MLILGIDPDRGYSLVRHGIVGEDGKYHEKQTQILFAGTVKGILELKKIIIDCRAYAAEENFLAGFRGGFLVRIERPINLKTFQRPGLSPAAMMRIAQNCGQNYRKATELGEYCQELGLQVEFVALSRKKWGKIPWKQFNRLTGYTGRSSEHARDAIAIALR